MSTKWGQTLSLEHLEAARKMLEEPKPTNYYGIGTMLENNKIQLVGFILDIIGEGIDDQGNKYYTTSLNGHELGGLKVYTATYLPVEEIDELDNTIDTASKAV